MIPINYMAVILAAIVQMALGALWYGPLFGKPWLSAVGFTDEHIKAVKAKGMGGSYTLMAVGALVMSWVLATFIGSAEAHYGIWSAGFGAHIAVLLWLGFVAPVTLGSVLWEGRSWKLWFLNAGYYFVGICIMGAILGGWH